jgi:SnoaL-like protein
MTAINTVLTKQQLVTRFTELAQQEKWFDIQDELFADHVKSIEPPNSPYMDTTEGKSAVRKKAEDFVKKVEEVHSVHTSEVLVTGNHLAVAREMDITVNGFGRIQLNEIMLYEVKDGQIVSEQFFY